MLSNDLLSYSIMSNGEKAIVHSLPHYASLINTKPESGVQLPPITSYVSLTENTLDSLSRYLPSTVFSQSNPPSLTSSSSSGGSPFSSPRIRCASFGEASISNSSTYTQTSPLSSPVANRDSLSQKKRRQRLGPSCDCCRSRKVKCNADVVTVCRKFTGVQDLVTDLTQNEGDDETGHYKEYLSLSEIQKLRLHEGEMVQTLFGYTWVLTNSKLVKFKPCTSCATKGFNCSFSKGFTKEDIIYSKRHSVSEDITSSNVRAGTMPNRVQKNSLSESGASVTAAGKSSTRKSSCGACRKRKVKCVVSSHHGRCVSCIKKDIPCTF